MLKNKTSKKAILDQVEKICASAELKPKQKLCNLLRYLVEETIAGREERLKGYKVGVEVFGKDEDFDPEQDPLVRIHAGRLRRMLKLYYLETGRKDSLIIDIPKGKYIPFFKSNRYRQEAVAEPSSQGNRALKPTVAIMPFKNFTGNREKDHFALGFSEELSVELTKLDDLTVFESVPFYSSSLSDSDRYQYLREKRIRFVIEGGIMLTDTQIKVLVRLTDMKAEEQIWAERYLAELTASNLFEIQENIIFEISGILGSEYGIILHQVSNEIDHDKHQQLGTFNAISKYYHFEAHQTPQTAREAFEALEKAISNEPQSGIAHALLAALYGNRYMLDYLAADEALVKNREHTELAIRLNPHSMVVNVIYAWMFFINNDKKRFIQQTEHCLTRKVSPSMRLGSLGFHLSLYGEWEKGKAVLDDVMHTKISYPLYYHGATCLYHYRKKEYDQSLKEALKYNLPVVFWGSMLRAAVYGQLHKKTEARKNTEHLLQLKPDFISKAPYLISRFVKEKELVDHIVEGLKKAGLPIKSE